MWCWWLCLFPASQRSYRTGSVAGALSWRWASMRTAEQTLINQPWEETFGEGCESGLQNPWESGQGNAFPLSSNFKIKNRLGRNWMGELWDAAFSKSFQRFRKWDCVKYMLNNERVFLESTTECSVLCIHCQLFLGTVHQAGQTSVLIYYICT